MRKEPMLIEGGRSIDDRGSVSFVNPFDFKGVKRFYAVSNFSTEVVRAWHGHRKEGKYVYVASGAAIVAAVRMTDTREPSASEKVHRYTLAEERPSVLWIPPGFANGFRALVPGTVLLFFSTATLEGSKGDDYRFPHDYFGKDVWQVENR